MGLLLTKRMCGTLALGLSSVAALGCEDSELVARCKELVAPIEQAAESPTGTLDANTAKKLLVRVYGAGAPPAAFSQVVSDAACTAGEGTEDDPQVTDMACATNGAMTGSFVSMSEAQGDDVYTLVSYDMVCLADVDFCFDGPGAFVVTHADDQTKTLVGHDLDVVRDGRAERERFGFARAGTRAGSVFYDGDASFLLGPTPILDPEDESYVFVVAGNGEFDCSFTDGGEHGRCEGPTSFEW